MYYRYKYIRIGDNYFLAGRTVLRTKRVIPFEEIGTIRPEIYCEETTGIFFYKRIPNPEYIKSEPSGLENLPYTIIEESSEPIRSPKLNISVKELAAAVVAFKNGDTTALDEIEQKLEDDQGENI